MCEFEEDVKHSCTQQLEVLHSLYQNLTLLRMLTPQSKFHGSLSRAIKDCAYAIERNQHTLDLLATGASEEQIREARREATHLTAKVQTDFF